MGIEDIVLADATCGSLPSDAVIWRMADLTCKRLCDRIERVELACLALLLHHGRIDHETIEETCRNHFSLHASLPEGDDEEFPWVAVAREVTQRLRNLLAGEPLGSPYEDVREEHLAVLEMVCDDLRTVLDRQQVYDFDVPKLLPHGVISDVRHDVAREFLSGPYAIGAAMAGDDVVLSIGNRLNGSAVAAAALARTVANLARRVNNDHGATVDRIVSVEHLDFFWQLLKGFVWRSIHNPTRMFCPFVGDDELVERIAAALMSGRDALREFRGEVPSQWYATTGEPSETISSITTEKLVEDLRARIEADQRQLEDLRKYR